MGKKEIISAVKIAALLICFAMAFLGGNKVVVYLGSVGIVLFCSYAVYKVLSRSAVRSAEESELRKRAMNDLHRISEVLGCDE